MLEKFYCGFLVFISISGLIAMDKPRIEKAPIIEHYFSSSRVFPQSKKNYYEKMEFYFAKYGCFSKIFVPQSSDNAIEKSSTTFSFPRCMTTSLSSYIPTEIAYFGPKEEKNILEKTLDKINKTPLVFDWEKSYQVSEACKYRAGKRKYLYYDKYNLRIYDIDLQKKLIETQGGPSGWSDDYSCFFTIQQQQNKDFIAKIYDFQNNTTVSLKCQDDRSFHHLFTCGSAEDVCFIFQIENALYITQIRGAKKTKIIGLDDMSIRTVRVYGSYLWVLYNTKSKENVLIVYDMLSDYKDVKTITAKTINPVLIPNGSVDDHATWCIDGHMTVFNTKNNDIVYASSHKMGMNAPLVALWNHDKSMFAVSQLKSCGDVVVHDVARRNSVLLERAENETLVADVGFQDDFVIVRSLDGQGSSNTLEIYDSITGTKTSQKEHKTVMKSCGLCTSDCIFFNSSNKFCVYNFKEDKEIVNLWHDGTINKISKNQKYFIVRVDADELNIITLAQAKTQEIVRNSQILNAWFDVEGEKYIALTYGATLEIIDIQTLKVVTTMHVGAPVEHVIFNDDATLCAVFIDKKQTMIVYDTLDGEKSLAKMPYESDIDLENILFADDKSGESIFVVPTHSKTYVYKTKN